MASDKLYNATSYMKDRWHYSQLVYNVVGKDSASNTVAFFNGQTPIIKHFDSSDALGIPTEYGTLDDWTYTLVNEKVRLNAYNGSNPNVRVYHQYKLGDYYYEARIMRSPSWSNPACFTGNTTIQTVTVDSGVRMMNPSNNTDTDNQQSLALMFKECTALTSVTVANDFPNIVEMGDVFRGATAFTTFNFADKLNNISNASYAFQGTKITSYDDVYASSSVSYMFSNCTDLTEVGNVKGTYNVANAMFQNCSNLETVGTIESTALTNISNTFLNCTKLTGTVRFESAGITHASNAFYNCDLSKITIQCPADSTTYTTLSTAYPTANIVTF